jgi:HJR/Mrr/RecB family endonuclease
MHLITYLIAALVAISLGMIIRRIVRGFKVKKRHVYTISDVNTLNGLAFERHVADVLRGNGHKKVHLTEYYDYGVDIIAEKDGIRCGVQVKYYSGLVGIDTVRQVMAGLKYYHCDKAMVITNSSYTKVAVKLARSNQCTLVDGHDYMRLV